VHECSEFVGIANTGSWIIGKKPKFRALLNWAGRDCTLAATEVVDSTFLVSGANG
jgi:hypothetical protein